MLTGSEVGLRAIQPEDLEFLREWRNRPENRRYFREYREIGVASQLNWYENLQANERAVMFAIERLDNGWLVGATGLCGIDWVRRSAEVSLYIGDGYVDSIYAPDALHALLLYGFHELGLRRIQAETYAFDAHKQNLLLEADFRQEGILRDAHWAEGQWHDSLIYSLLFYEFREERDGLSW